MTATVPPSRTPPNLERRTLALQLVNRRQAWHERVHGWKGGTEGALGCGNGNGDSACVCARNYAGAELSRAVADDGNDDNVETGADVNKTRTHRWRNSTVYTAATVGPVDVFKHLLAVGADK